MRRPRIERTRSLSSRFRIGLFVLGTCVVSTVAFLSIYGSKSRAEAYRAPRSQPVATPTPRSLTAEERKAQDEATILLEVLRHGTRKLGSGVYVGIRREKDIVDPSPEMMRTLLADNPQLRPASELRKLPQAKPSTESNTKKIWPDTIGNKPRFTLMAAGDLRWKSAKQVEVSSLYHSSGGRFSDVSFQVFRGGTVRAKKTDRVTRSGWIFRGHGRGCGGWRWMKVANEIYPGHRAATGR
jgi:hypothetical protein